MKKVLFFINTLGCGGAEHVLVDIVNCLDKDMQKRGNFIVRTGTGNFTGYHCRCRLSELRQRLQRAAPFSGQRSDCHGSGYDPAALYG